MNISKNKYIILILCVLFSFIFLVIIAHFGNAQSPVVADNPKSRAVIKIPPPIEGALPEIGNTPQILNTANITILNANGDRLKYIVELAVTPKEQRIGMMFRKYINENTGMLFLFNDVGERRFWMRNTLIPLDIIFIRRDGVIHYIHPMAEAGSLKGISSQGDVYAVLEIAGGESEILGINVGDRIMYSRFKM